MRSFKERYPRHKTPWTPEDEDLLQEDWGTCSVKTIAGNLGRTVASVQRRASELGLGRAVDNSTMILFADLIRELKMPKLNTRQMKVLLDAGFPMRTFRANERFFKMVDIEEFWEFAEANPHFFDFSKLEKNALGMEPWWVQDARKTYMQHNAIARKRNKEWTNDEDKELVRLINTNLSLLEIAKRLGRTEAGVHRRLYTLCISVPKKSKHVYWKENDIQFLKKLILEGKTYELMGFEMNRTTNSIRSKLKRMYGTEALEELIRILEEEREK